METEVTETCLDNYETLMDSCLNNLSSLEELVQIHNSFRDQVIQNLPKNWIDLFGNEEMPSNLESEVRKEIETSFRLIKKHFEKTKVRGQQLLTAVSAQHDALQNYNEKMNKYFIDHPNLSTTEVQVLHDNLFSEALLLAKKQEGFDAVSHFTSTLTNELEKRYKFYMDKVLMSLRSVKDPAIGIDLGTTMCCVMVFHRGKVEIVQNITQGSRNTTPSFVCYNKDNSNTFGWVAKDEAYRYPETTIYDAKRMIGRKWSDKVLQEDRKTWPFEVVEDEDENPKVKAWDRLRYPHEISSRLLAHFRTMAEKHLELTSGSVKKAVITVPAYFTETQRNATKESAMCAGIEVLNILSEPTAAAIAYSWERTQNGTRNALIYDLGGGTFDVAIAKLSEKDVDILVVDGDTHLGGQDFDQLLVKYCLEEFEKTEGIDLYKGRDSENKKVRDEARSILTRIKLQCEKVKENLSSVESDNVDLACVHGTKHLRVKITRTKMNELVKPLLQKTINIVDRAIKAARPKGVAKKQDIHDVILVGGSTRMPIVDKMLQTYFNKKDLCQSINPDQAVAYGAAVQAALLNKDPNVKTIIVNDVTPMTVGISVYYLLTFWKGFDSFERIIPKNSKIPCKFKTVVGTYLDNQTSMTIDIYQGEKGYASENNWLGKFHLTGIPLGPRGQEQVQVTMKINSMGILHVEAVSLTTGSSNAITIKSEKLGMTSEKIDQLTKELQSLTT